MTTQQQLSSSDSPADFVAMSSKESENEDAYQLELSKGSEDEDEESTSNLSEHSAGDALVADAQTPDSEHECPQKESWHKQFYLLSFLCDLEFIMLELHWCSPLCHQSLLYCQFYNTIKKIFAAGQHFLFANENLDMLALDSGLQSYGTWEEYWVTAAVLQAMD
ncbi:hypothetical protein CIHG_10346 [Coccidioides immitis H538.4]|uniref:Uncharacterized protein n=1 Tax=Coccidioides immitis H538.4 TaxID=396776 RepID=A0A0J8S828_COCIT|nr:hypothetical protein CIHG_10346 [Coccidioides immitis H538.4]